MRIMVSGSSVDAQLVAISYAQELSVERNFRARSVEAGLIASAVTVSMRECGRALATPARVGRRTAWADAPLREFDEVVQQIRSAIGAIAIFGGSGGGKTTFMEHIADGCLEHETIVVVCPHGELSVRLAAIAARRGIPFDAISFGDIETPPAFNLLQSPHRLISLGEWIVVIPEIILATHRTLGLTYDMAGPVWYHNFGAATEVLATSRIGTILDTAPLLSDSRLTPELQAAIDNLEDEGLKRRISEARHAIAKSSDGNYAVFMNAKLHFLQAPRVKAVFGRSHNSFDLDNLFEHGRHLFVSASVADLGEHGAAVTITALLRAIYEVARRQPAAKRRRIRVMIPEAHLVDPSLLCSLLAEGRKFGIVGTVVDLQTPTTLDRKLQTSLLGNAGVISSFRLGPADAIALDGRYPTIPATRIQQLRPFRMAVTFGDSDAMVDTLPPLSDDTDSSAFDEAHRRTQSHRPRSRRKKSEPSVSRPLKQCDAIADPAASDDVGRHVREMLGLDDD